MHYTLYSLPKINLPNKPTINHLLEDNNTITVNWSVLNDNSNPITGIIVYLKKSTETVFDSFSALAPNTTTYQYNVLNGYSYSIKVVAINSAGSTESDISTSNVIIGPPSDISGLVAYGINESIYLQWIAPVSNIRNPISDYKIFYKVNNGVEVNVDDLQYSSTQNNYTLTRLRNGSIYTIRMYTINKINGIEKFRSNEITINNVIPYVKPTAINTLNIQRNQNTIEVLKKNCQNLE